MEADGRQPPQLPPFNAMLALANSGRYVDSMADHLFTVVCDFDGGTYISQVRALNERQALLAWAKGLRRDRPMGDDADNIATVASEDVDPLVPLDRLTGVWCWTANVGGRLVLANIVQSG